MVERRNRCCGLCGGEMGTDAEEGWEVRERDVGAIESGMRSNGEGGGGLWGSGEGRKYVIFLPMVQADLLHLSPQSPSPQSLQLTLVSHSYLLHVITVHQSFERHQN